MEPISFESNYVSHIQNNVTPSGSIILEHIAKLHQHIGAWLDAFGKHCCYKDYFYEIVIILIPVPWNLVPMKLLNGRQHSIKRFLSLWKRKWSSQWWQCMILSYQYLCLPFALGVYAVILSVYLINQSLFNSGVAVMIQCMFCQIPHCPCPSNKVRCWFRNMSTTFGFRNISQPSCQNQTCIKM